MSKNKKKKKEEYSICKVCRINQNEGRRHNYFPRHINSLTSLFSRFLHKLSLLNSSLSNPTLTLPNNSSPPFWCIFCELDIDNNNTSFLSGNTIKHLASDDHLKNVKHFLWKYGRGTNTVDSFRVTEEMFSKWEKKCEVLKSKAVPASGFPRGSLCGELNDIQPNSRFLNNFNKNKSHFLESNLSNNVLPLQHDTNKNYQVCHSDMSEAGKIGTSQQDRSSLIPEVCLNTWCSTFLDNGTAHSLPSSAANLHADDRAHKGVCKNERITNRESSLNGYHTLTRITSENSGDDKGNVHSGAPPPWLVGTDSAIDIRQSTTSRSNNAQKNCRKTSKLNPKRVGAAWADKRRKELEMEKRGETIANTSAPDWLPNFGSVWQSGSRKESMKEFKKEKVNVPMADSQLEAEVKLQPYVSKRMRLGTNNFSGVIQEAGDMS